MPKIASLVISIASCRNWSLILAITQTNPVSSGIRSKVDEILSRLWREKVFPLFFHNNKAATFSSQLIALLRIKEIRLNLLQCLQDSGLVKPQFNSSRWQQCCNDCSMKNSPQRIVECYQSWLDKRESFFFRSSMHYKINTKNWERAVVDELLKE